jgi:hypothetical protein
MIGFMKKNSTDSEKIISFFEKNNWLTNWVLLEQVKRKDNWIFKTIKDNKEFKNMLSKYNK